MNTISDLIREHSCSFHSPLDWVDNQGDDIAGLLSQEPLGSLLQIRKTPCPHSMYLPRTPAEDRICFPRNVAMPLLKIASGLLSHTYKSIVRLDVAHKSYLATVVENLHKPALVCF